MPLRFSRIPIFWSINILYIISLLESGIGYSNNYNGVPTSAAHFAEQMESGGARIEDALHRLNCRYQSLFFAAAIFIVFGATIALISSIFSFELANIVNSTFLEVFGIIMILLDVPGNPRWSAHYRAILRKYVRFLTLLTGKGLWFLFLGCLTASTLWPTKKGGNGFLLFAVVISFSAVVVSIIGLMMAIRRSLRLERIRKAIVSQKGASPDVYRKYALCDPNHGMQFEEFNRLCSDYSSGRVQFDIADLGIIYNALDDHQKCAVNEREFNAWMKGHMTYL
ncbi:putative COPI associated protein [Cardiosporidium cionae]|uniref:COPI associated protein n=1 Tax=Cardiosporidium cionae TaxID=476202 RepID=A0ABQ7J9M9_9APIC|nr:putative COPI associated protein [Cardiosporidium cionae]|eukprot:KAF8820708.1 putative COPI associated protein [Cardiosporidium cionae]